MCHANKNKRAQSGIKPYSQFLKIALYHRITY